MKFLFSTISILLLLLVSNLNAEVPDSCLKLVVVDSPNAFNLYDLKIDSCKDSPTYGKEFSKGPFVLTFWNNILPRSVGTVIDSMVYYKWSDILSTYPKVKSDFEILEQHFGNYNFIEKYNTKSDTLVNEYRILSIMFEEYVSVESLLQALDTNSALLDYVFGGGIYWLTDFIEENTPNEHHKSLIISKGIINLEKLNILIDESISIFNFQGHLLINTTNTSTIDISDYLNGLYFLRLNRSGKVIKIIKE